MWQTMQAVAESVGEHFVSWNAYGLSFVLGRGAWQGDSDLSFFYETDSQCWGYDPKDKGCARVFWFEDTSVLSPVEFPEDMGDDFKFPMVKIDMSKAVSYPSEADFFEVFPSEGDSDDFKEAFEEATGTSVYDMEYGSQLLGWPDVIQYSMFAECELVTQGYLKYTNALRSLMIFMRKVYCITIVPNFLLLLTN